MTTLAMPIQPRQGPLPPDLRMSCQKPPIPEIANLLNQCLTQLVDDQEYEADKKRRLGEKGAKPKRIRYKPISR